MLLFRHVGLPHAIFVRSPGVCRHLSILVPLLLALTRSKVIWVDPVESRYENTRSQTGVTAGEARNEAGGALALGVSRLDPAASGRIHCDRDAPPWGSCAVSTVPIIFD